MMRENPTRAARWVRSRRRRRSLMRGPMMGDLIAHVGKPPSDHNHGMLVVLTTIQSSACDMEVPPFQTKSRIVREPRNKVRRSHVTEADSPTASEHAGKAPYDPPRQGCAPLHAWELLATLACRLVSERGSTPCPAQELTKQQTNVIQAVLGDWEARTT